jgi:hypothetical protein
MSDKVKRFPSVRLAQFALLLCSLQSLLTLRLFLMSQPPASEGGGAPTFHVGGFLYVVLLLVSFWSPSGAGQAEGLRQVARFSNADT